MRVLIHIENCKLLDGTCKPVTNEYENVLSIQKIDSEILLTYKDIKNQVHTTTYDRKDIRIIILWYSC